MRLTIGRGSVIYLNKLRSGTCLLIPLVFRCDPSKLAVLLVKAGEWGVETPTYNSVTRNLEAGWHARMSSRQR